ncbi:hypothetical protein CRYUN_Cryun09bG0153200 [Craigia yunnanensis]
MSIVSAHCMIVSYASPVMNVERLMKMTGAGRTSEKGSMRRYVHELQDILPGIINQLGPDNLDNLRKLAEQFQKQAPATSAGAGATTTQEEDDDEVPVLVDGETFKAIAEEGKLLNSVFREIFVMFFLFVFDELLLFLFPIYSFVLVDTLCTNVFVQN